MKSSWTSTPSEHSQRFDNIWPSPDSFEANCAAAWSSRVCFFRSYFALSHDVVDTCWHMLTHVDTCWHMLTHVDKLLANNYGKLVSLQDSDSLHMDHQVSVLSHAMPHSLHPFGVRLKEDSEKAFGVRFDDFWSFPSIQNKWSFLEFCPFRVWCGQFLSLQLWSEAPP